MMRSEAETARRERRLVLPPLGDKHGLEEERSSHPYPILATIAAGLRVENDGADAGELVSIPDVWAQVEVFRAALFDERHPLHARAEGQWRGLLAFFALRYSRGFEVSIDCLRFGRLTGNGTDRESERRNDRGVMAILGKVRPKVALPGHDWSEIGLIRVGGNVVGLVVPTTIVCPARRPPAALVERLPWIAHDRIVDPLTVPDLSGEEIALLAEFSQDASSFLVRPNGEPNADYNARFAARGLFAPEDAGRVALAHLKIAFDRFKQDAEEIVALKRLGRDLRGTFRPRRLHLDGLPGQRLYPLLTNVKVRGPSRSEPLSETMLPTRPELQEAGLNGIIIIDPNLPQAFGVRAAEINVWRGIKLQQVLDHKDELDRVVVDAAANGYLCLDPKDFFTSYFYRMNNVQVDAHPSLFKDALLPITPAVMMLLRPEDLPHSIEIAVGHMDNTVTLRLKLSGINGRDDRVYTVRKAYPLNDIINREPPTTLSFWPDFEHPEWRWHFTYYGGRLTQQFAPRMLVSMPAMAGFIAAGAANPAARVRQAKQLVSEAHLLVDDRLPLDQTETPIELYRSEAAPEALYCDFVLDVRTPGFVESRARTPAGILLVPHRKPQPSSEECAIAIDFGTVNTSVYRRIGGGNPEPMSFRSHLVLPFAVDSPEKELPYRGFLPLKDIQIPFMTVLRDRQLQGVVAERLPIWSSLIYYVTDVARGLGELEVSESTRDAPLLFGLKWGVTPEERLPIRTFLAQAALQALAEVMARGIAPHRVTWRFSYPEAYSPSQQDDFFSAAAHAIEIAAAPDGSVAPKMTSDSESLSTALYFMKARPRDAPAMGDLVTIDIGGLTSDVSIWHNRRLIWRNSLKLAGQHILLRYLLAYPDLVGRVADIHVNLRPLNERITNLPDDKRQNGYEMLINSRVFQDEFVENLHLMGGEPTGRTLRAVAELALLGILHYVGRTMQYCAKKSDGYRPKQAHIAVCLGGRASMLYKSLFDLNGQRSQLDPSLGALQDAAPGLIGGAQLVYSDRPKHEVAYGLLVPQQGALGLDVEADDYRVKDIILGEEVRSGDSLLRYDSVTRELGIAGEWQVLDLNELKAFVASLEHHSRTIMAVQLDAGAERAILNAVKAQLVTDRETLEKLSADGKLKDGHVQSESTVIEPPFIVGLRELVDLVIAGQAPLQLRR
jgi:hypothetical protein